MAAAGVPLRTALPGGPSTFRALADAFVPEAAQLAPADWAEAAAIVSLALGRRPPAVRRQLSLFVGVLQLVALARHGRTLRALPAPRRTALLERLARSRLLLVRRGVWGLRTLAFMGVYAREGAHAAIGYRASAAGWSARRS